MNNYSHPRFLPASPFPSPKWDKQLFAPRFLPASPFPSRMEKIYSLPRARVVHGLQSGVAKS